MDDLRGFCSVAAVADLTFLYTLLVVLLTVLAVRCLVAVQLQMPHAEPQLAAAPAEPPGQKHTVPVQSQTRYCLSRANLGFEPLTQRDHGAWVHGV